MGNTAQEMADGAGAAIAGYFCDVGKSEPIARVSGPRSVPDVHVSPASRNMAALAILAECTPVRVFAGMTGAAIGGELQTGRRFGLVTGFANDLFMRSRQREFRLTRMIKAPARPAVRIVAIAATVSEPPLMEVLVTSGAGRRRALVRGRAMAFLARNRGMQSDQRKARQFVIERQTLSPIGIVVASFAAFAQRALVRIVIAVT